MSSHIAKIQIEKMRTSSESTDNSQVSILKNQIILNPTISLINYISFNLYYLIIIFAYVSVDTLQPILLSSSSYYNIPQKDLTNVNSTILVWDMSVKVILAPFYGLFCDRIGRKPVVFIGIISMALGIGLFPFIGHGDVFPYYILARAIYANGAIACIVVPLLADYVDYETKGRASGLLVVLAGTGALMSSSYCLSLTENISLGDRYLYLSIIILVSGLIVGIGMKGGKYHKKLYRDVKAEQAREVLSSRVKVVDEEEADRNTPLIIENTESPAEKQGFVKNFTNGIQQARNPWIMLGYIVSFLSRGDTGILTFSIVIWSKHYYPSTEEAQKKAETQAYILAGIAYTMLFVTAMFFGFFGDKYSKFKSLIVVYVSTIIGIIMLVLSSGPKDTLSFIAMVFIGIGVAGYQTFSLQLVNKYANAKYRGSVNAMSSLLGVIGLIVISIGGGYLMGLNINASFYLFAAFTALALVITSVLYVKSEVVQKL